MLMKYTKTDKNVKHDVLYDNTKEKAIPKNHAIESELWKEEPNLKITGDLPIDDLQVSVFQSGKRMLNILCDKKLAESDEVFEKAEKAIQDLGHFSYDIGFAGEQSCGKSTVINSLLQYPLMPTCQLTTTASVVRIAYSEHFRVRAFDDDTQKVVLDFDCEIPQKEGARKRFLEQFNRLLDYGISAMKILIIENFQYYSKVDVRNFEVTAADMEMTPEDPKHVMLLMFVLLAVYVGQNDASWGDKTARLMEKRKALFQYFGIPKDTVNLSVFGQANFEVLKSGLIITDLPGLGSNAGNQKREGKKVKGHDEITKQAIGDTETMVFLTTPENRREGYEVLPEMLSNAKLKETVFKGNRIIPVMNKVDRCGKMEREAAIQSFLKALTASGVNKVSDDIILYSGIFGEYNYKDIPFERTLYYTQNYDERTLQRTMRREHCTLEEAKEQYINDLREDMGYQYEDSGIEKLKHFFRTVYVEGGKYNKSVATVQAIRSVFLTVVSALEQAAKSCSVLSSAQTTIMQDVVKSMESAVKRPTADIISRQNTELNRISEDVNSNMESYLSTVPICYTSAFQSDLKGYKKKLTDIMNGFELNWLGIGSKALISTSGSANRERYLKLMDEIDQFPVSLVTVNLQYEKILEFTRGKIDRFYDDTLNGLEKLKDDIQEALENSIKKAEEQNLGSGELETLKQLKDQLILFVDKQTEATKENLNNQQKLESDAQYQIINAIFDLNEQMTDQYTDSIKQQLKNRISSGLFFSSREYLLIDGPDGMKTAVSNLDLTDEELGNIEANIEAGVNVIIRNKLPNWVDGLYDSLYMYNVLNNQIEKPMSEMVAVMSNSAEENKKKLVILNEKIREWRELGDAYKQGVQPYMRIAFRYMKDKEPGNLLLQENVLHGCFAER